MSRCFPFPPPGYERKHRLEDFDLLKEAKCKEKKHKKEKKDKERKKDKEKEKDGTAEKHRDKKDQKEKKHKDKKEKHRDKKKDKEDRGKDKEKSSIPEESAVARNEEISEAKLYPGKDRSNFLGEGKCSALLQDQNGGKPSQSSLPSQGNEESKFVQELDRRIRDETSRGSQLPERVAVAVKKDQEMAVRDAVRNSSGVLSEQKSDDKNKRVDKKMDPQALKNEFGGNMMSQNLMPIVKSKGEGIPTPANEENGWRLEDEEKYKETVEIKRGDKQKNRSKDCHGKEKKKDDKAKGKTENKKSEQDKLKDDGRNNLRGFSGNKSTDMLKGASSNAVNEGNIKKRKDMGTNGFLHESEIRPNKMQRPAPHQLTENGRKLEPFRTPTKSSNDKHAAVPNSFRVDNKDQLIDGIFESQEPSPSKPNNPPAATMVSDQIADASKLPQLDSNDLEVSKMEDPIAEASRKPPHPDSKYLDEVLTVPKNVADWSENDDQDWLFSEKVVPSKPKLDSFGDVKEDVRVWSEAVHIVSADVCALPYVIPY